MNFCLEVAYSDASGTSAVLAFDVVRDPSVGTPIRVPSVQIVDLVGANYRKNSLSLEVGQRIGVPTLGSRTTALFAVGGGKGNEVVSHASKRPGDRHVTTFMLYIHV